ncbi:MAG: nucleotidyltransferase [Chloroflexota bacterium]|nr:MAG: nucleotidyltransferase [Chloroflexota bacterium]
MIAFPQLLQLLTGHDVAFVIVGGVAAVIHGSSRLTQDLDVVYERTPENLLRLENALAEQAPYLRGAPPGLPFEWSAATLQNGLNFTLETRLGALDLLGEIVGGGKYENLIQRSDEIEIFGVRCRCLDLPTLIETKRAAGRPKDFEAIAELKVILEEDKKR